MSSSIRTNINAAVSALGINPEGSEYGRYVNAVVEAMEEREFTITETIVTETSRQFGVSEEDVTNAVKARTDLNFRPIPEPVFVPTPIEDVDLDDLFDAEDALEASDSKGKKGSKGKRIDALESKLDKLIELANRHLGSSL